MAKFLKGRFKPRNPQKYLGDPTNIVYRSSYELKVFMMLDSHPSVTKWASEEFCIPYKNPVDRRYHRYFPDIYVESMSPDGFIEKTVYEIKPKTQTAPPKKRDKITKSYKREVITWGINKAKWEAAEEYCSKRGWKFEFLTEDEIFGSIR